MRNAIRRRSDRLRAPDSERSTPSQRSVTKPGGIERERNPVIGDGTIIEPPCAQPLAVIRLAHGYLPTKMLTATRGPWKRILETGYGYDPQSPD